MGVRVAVLALGTLLLGVTLGATPVQAAPEDFIEACSNGIAVLAPEDNRGLVQDCAILLSARDTLAGDATLDWSADMQIRRWEGVELRDSPPRVFRVDLANKGLSGSIPREVGLLSSIEFLSLWGNHLVGEIPESFVDLVNLRILYLSENNLQGCIPLKLRSIGMNDLHRMGNRYCPPSQREALESCSDSPLLASDCAALIRVVHILTGDSIGWGEWNKYYGNEAVANIVIGDCCPRRVVSLHLTNTNPWALGEIAADIGKLDGLKRLVLTRQKARGQLPRSIGNLKELQVLDLSGNSLTGSVPPEIAGLPNLRYLNLSHNQLEGKIPRLFVSDALESVQLQWNRLEGEIPQTIGTLLGLETLWLHGNRLGGEVPGGLGLLPSLEWLRLGGNEFAGCLPLGIRDVSRHDLDSLNLPDCPEPEPGETGTGLAPTPHAAIPLAVNVGAVLVTLAAVLGIVSGLRTCYRH